ncbi:hypothetical protein BASA81_006794 [Batrachochytrium salamandrivorans]|nr:hypothetical protein BASA81_006794 [Batrachochytrium salamandrivorans]
MLRSLLVRGGGRALTTTVSPFPKTEIPPEFAERWARFHPAKPTPPPPKPEFPSKLTLVFMDVETKPLGSQTYQPLGRIVFSLFTHVAPKTSENFRQLCLGKSEKRVCDRGADIPLDYKHSPIHRVIPGFLIQGGDFQLRNGFGGESVYGPRFPDESFERKHDQALLLGMANVGPNTNASQFYVTLQPTAWLDGLNVVFGKVIKGANVIKHLEQMGSHDPEDDGKVVGGKIRIARAGQLLSPDSDVETDDKVVIESAEKEEVKDAEEVVEEEKPAAQ